MRIIELDEASDGCVSNIHVDRGRRMGGIIGGNEKGW